MAYSDKTFSSKILVAVQWGKNMLISVVPQSNLDLLVGNILVQHYLLNH